MSFHNHSMWAPFKESVAIKGKWSDFLSNSLRVAGTIYIYLSFLHMKETAYAERIFSPFYGWRFAKFLPLYDGCLYMTEAPELFVK